MTREIMWLRKLEKTLESPLDCKEIQPAHSEGDQPWDFFGRNDAKAETPVLWPRHAKSWLIGKDFDTGRDWRQEEKGMTEDEMAGWYHWLDGHEFEWTPGVVDGREGMACCDSWCHKESDMTERLNWTELNWVTNTKTLWVTQLFRINEVSPDSLPESILWPWNMVGPRGTGQGCEGINTSGITLNW